MTEAGPATVRPCADSDRGRAAIGEVPLWGERADGMLGKEAKRVGYQMGWANVGKWDEHQQGKGRA